MTDASAGLRPAGRTASPPAAGKCRLNFLYSQRTAPEDHYGTIVPFHFGDEDISAEIAALVKRMNPRVSFETYAAWRTPEAVLRCIDVFVEVGITKFAMRPMLSGPTVHDQFARLAELVVPRYHD